MVSDEEKRWLVVGLALNKTLVRGLVSVLEQGVRTEYQKLKGPPHHIHTQAPAGRLTKWPQYLKYENINGNDGHKLSSGRFDYSKFTYQVTSDVDFAKLYLQPFMAKFSTFAECDASVVLNLLGAVPFFPNAVQVAAADMRTNVRNEWAHCNFPDWDVAKFTNCFHYMEQLVKNLTLPAIQETQILNELKDWEVKGCTLIAGSLVDTSLIAMAQQDIASLQIEVANEYSKVKDLQDLSDKLSALEKKVAANTSEILANKDRIASQERKVESLSDRVDTLEGYHLDKSHDYCPMDEFAENMKSLISRTTEAQDKLLNSSDIPNMKVDDIYTNVVIQLGRVKYDQEMERREMLCSYPVPTNIPIERAEDLFLPVKNTEEPKSILIRGRAGIGKTLFSQMLIRDWAKGKLFSEEKNKSKFEFVFLFTFRQLNLIERPVTLRQFLSICSFCPEMTDETFDYIVRNPKSILFVFDGFDEVNDWFETKDVQDDSTEEKLTVAAVFAKIAAGKLLTNATVVITTRPEAEKSLDELKIQRDVEILGFTHNKVEEYIKKFFASTENRRHLVLDHILRNENLATFCYVPVHCFLVCSYLDWQLTNSPTWHDAELPSTITDIYKGVIRMFLLKHHTECRAKKEPRLSGCIQSTLDKLSELSLEFLKCRKFIFSDDDLQSYGVNEEEMSQLINSGLIHCIPGCRTGPFTIETYYCFLHLTLQEFLAALCLVKTRKLVSLQTAERSLSETLYSLSDVVTVFVAGILGAAVKQSLENLTDFNIKKEDANRRMESVINTLGGARGKIKLIKMLHEYGDRGFAQKVLREHELFHFFHLTLEEIADTECQALAFLLMTKVEAGHHVKNLVLYANSQLSHRGIRYIKEALCSENCRVKNLILRPMARAEPPDHNSQTMMQLLSEALKNKNCHLLNLTINSMCVDAKGAKYLSDALCSPECHLATLNLHDNQISDKGAEYLSGALISTECHLAILCLNNNQISDKGAEYLSGALSSTECCLEELQLRHNQLGDKGDEYLRGALNRPECQLKRLYVNDNELVVVRNSFGSLRVGN